MIEKHIVNIIKFASTKSVNNYSSVYFTTLYNLVPKETLAFTSTQGNVNFISYLSYTSFSG